MLKKLLLSTVLLIGLSWNVVVNAQNDDLDSKATLGVTLSEEEQNETLNVLGAGDVSNEDIIIIDGMMVNEYLKDGSTINTDIYSSAYVELKPEGYGVQVQILTPENITSVSESTYQSAAITAGAQNVLIKIAAITPVTGEGALTGVYETFEQAGFSLDESAITAAEDQLSIEQQLIELTDLTSSEVSTIINALNIEIIEAIGSGEMINEENLLNMINSILEENNYQFSEEAIALLIQHGLSYALSPAAQDEATRDVIETSTSESIIGEQFESGNIIVTIDDIYLTDERDEFSDSEFDNVLIIEYTLNNNHSQDYYTGQDFEVYVDGHKAEYYYSMYDKMGPVSPGRTISVVSSFGFNGGKDNIELELKDITDHTASATIIPVENIRDMNENTEIIPESIESEGTQEENEDNSHENELEYVEVKEGLLTTPGEYTIDPVTGRITLLKIVNPEETYEIAENFEVTIHTVKLLELSEVPAESVELLAFELGLPAEGGQYIQYEYTLVNDNDYKVTNTVFDRIIYSDGEQINDYVFNFGEPFELEANTKVSNAVAATEAPNGNLTGFTLSMTTLLNEQNNIEAEPIEISFE